MKDKVELEILEMIRTIGGNRTYEVRFPDKNIISIAKTVIAFGAKSIDFLSLKKGNRILLAKNSNNLFISIPPTMSSIKGYKLASHGKDRLHSSVAKYLEANSIKAGFYEISNEPVFYKGIDWYPIYEIEEENG